MVAIAPVKNTSLSTMDYSSMQALLAVLASIHWIDTNMAA
jgi:hypothetical protein